MQQPALKLTVCGASSRMGNVRNAEKPKGYGRSPSRVSFDYHNKRRFAVYCQFGYLKFTLEKEAGSIRRFFPANSLRKKFSICNCSSQGFAFQRWRSRRQGKECEKRKKNIVEAKARCWSIKSSRACLVCVLILTFLSIDHSNQETSTLCRNLLGNWREKKNNMSMWSCEDEKRFQVALLSYLEDFPNQWEEIGNMLGLSKEMVYQQYQILKNELGQVSPPQHTNSSTNNQPHKNNKGSSWTYEEHALFLLGVQKYGKGHWKNISEKAVGTRNATQLASHAQKFYIRQREKETIVHSRGSIHDFTLANYPPRYLNDLLSSHPHLAPGSYMIMQQPNSSIDRHLPLHNDHHSLPMTQLETQIPSTLHQSHQDALPAHYDFELNQLSTSMNQVGPQNPSGVQLQNPCHQPNSSCESITADESSG
ncbi:hypothetical protein K1719_023464 [Acacia pycnantha]|nr:hypothetical protein K1719_023464 [Acacia pycnantha]